MEHEKVMAADENIKLERRELDLLLQNGIRFEVPCGRKIRKFILKEATLGTLDRISRISLEMAFDEGKMQDADQAMNESRRLVPANAGRMARIVAIAVAGDVWGSPVFRPFLEWRRRIRVKYLERLFLHSVTPSQLYELATSIICAGNIGDFINSMRLLSGARTTLPMKSRIEKPA